MRDDKIQLGVIDASAFEHQDVQVDHPWSESQPLRIASQAQLEAFEGEEEIRWLQIGLQLEDRVGELRLVDHVAWRGGVQA